jgi:hypothetical protein
MVSVPRIKSGDRLGEPPQSPGELARVDDGHRKAGVRQRRGDDGLVTAGGLKRDDLWRQRLQAGNQIRKTFGIGSTAKGDGIGPDVDLDAVFADINADVAVALFWLIHLTLSPGHGLAARTTVRVRRTNRPAPLAP